jgi:TonB-dependent starch-binding outer membrane protein SusC
MQLKLLAKRLTVALLLFGMPFIVTAQQKTVTGKVTSDKDGSPVSGATVIAKGAKGTKTSAEGDFVIQVPAGTTQVVVSSVGFGSQNVSIGAGNTANVVLKASGEGLSEVVVVGYGTRKVKDATGSVASITAKDFNKGQISTPEQLFQGRTSGVVVSPSSGEPGAAATINIRGTSSVRGNQQPLYVVDGVPLDGGGNVGSASGIEGNSTPKNPLAFLNPNDIESINILKDASAAAIYGSRGANGVIIVITKSGKGNKGSLTFGFNTSIAKVAKKYDLLNSTDFLQGIYDIKIKAGQTPAVAAAAIAGVPINRGASTDWQDEVFRTAISQNLNLGWGFSRNGTSLRLSGSYDNQQGIVKRSGLKRATLRANFGQTFLENKALKLEITSTYSNVKNSYVANSNNAGFQGSLIGAMISMNPTVPVKGPNGLYATDGNARNPVAIINLFDDNDNINRILSNISLSYKITPELTFKTTVGLDYASGVRISFADPRLPTAFNGTNNVFGWDYQNSITGNGRASNQLQKTTNNLFENTLSYDKTFENKHNINVLLGVATQKTTTDYSSQLHWGLTSPVTSVADVFVKDIAAFKNHRVGAVPYYGESKLGSAFGRVNYIYDDKYLLTATIRRDGSSRFGTNNKFGTFPAFAAKWKVLNENFAQSSLGKIFSEFSVRANWGKIGSQDNIGDYASVNLTQTWVTDATGAIRTDNINTANPDLKWEESTTTGVGLDWSTKNKRLSGTIDYFKTDRKNVIVFTQVPGGFSGVGNWYANLPGVVTNTGLEFSLNAVPVKSNNFTWDVNYNMTFLKNNIKGINVPINTGEVNGQGLSGAYAQTIRSGYPLFSWVMPVFTGFDANGLALYEKGASDQVLGSALPTFIMGITNNFNYRRWNASIFLNAATGFYVYNNTANALFLAGSLNTAHNIDYKSLRAGENFLNPGSVSSRFLEKGDFLRVSNLLIGYDFKIKNKYIKNLNASISGQNLALFTNYSGLDPEVNVNKGLNGSPSRGFDYAGYPKARTWTLGFNIGF